MSTITALTLVSGLRPEHRICFDQIRESVVFCNGHDENKLYSVKTNTVYSLGLATPAAPATSFPGTGLTGSYSYRVRWKDAVTQTVGPASAATTVSPVNQSVRIAQPAAPPARATHWIVERTEASGKIYYPANVTTSAPDGTAIGSTTYDDSLADATLNTRIIYPDVQGQLAPYRFCWANNTRMFFGGGRVHKPSCVMTNASAAVSSADGGFVPVGFTNATTPLIGQQFNIPTDLDGKSYKILTVTDSNNLTLDAVYTGSSATKTANIAGQRDRVAWSEPGDVEAYGSQRIGILSNELRVGDDGAPVIAGCGMGFYGCLYAKEQSLYLHSYFQDPMPPALSGDGKVLKLQTRRGALGSNCLRFIDGYVYGIDYRGIWRMAPTGLPQEIASPLSAEWVSNALNFAAADNWHIGYDPFDRWILFALCEGTDTYPKRRYVYDLEATPGNEWIQSLINPLGVTCSTERPDSIGLFRNCYYQEAKGSAGSYEYMDGIGTALGAHPNNTPMTGTATAGGNTTLTDSTATFYTTDEALKGVAVTKTAVASGLSETKIITSNTGTVLTVDSAWSVNPVAGDTYRIGELLSIYRTPRIWGDIAERKKVWHDAWVWMRNKPTAVKLYVRVYHDGASTPDSDIVVAQAEDGVTRAANTSAIAIDSTTSGVYRFKVPLNKHCSSDIQFEFYSLDAGEPWEVMAVEVLYDLDENVMPVEV